MTTLLLQRLGQSLIVLLAVGLIAFSLFRFVGDPVENLLGQERTVEDIARVRQQLGLDQPVPIQFARFVASAAQGNLGMSWQQGRPVSAMLAERIPATLELAAISGILAITCGIALGVFTAVRRHAFSAKLVMSISLIGVSLPTFVIAIALIAIFAVYLRWLPSFGRGETVDLGWWTTGLLTVSGWKAIILPALTLGLYQMTLILRLVRAQMIEVLASEHVRFARARGLPERTVLFRHALPNTLVPVISVIGLQLGSIIAFAIVTETVFQWPGVGLMFIKAVEFVDIPVLAAYLMLIALLFVSINLVVDLLQAVLDPRALTRDGSA